MALLFTIIGVLAPLPANAVPAFARQTGATCDSCHFQHFPALNSFGRAFKQTAYTMSGTEENVETNNLSLPRDLSASLITKVRYQKSNGTGTATDTGELQFPDEAALLIGGRGGNNLGFLFEFVTFGAADTGTGEITVGPPDVADTGSGDVSLFGSFKAHFNHQVKGTNVGAVLFTTDSGGVSYGFELLNTGAQRFLRPAEDRQATSAQQWLNLGSGAAEGVALVASNDTGFANLTLWTPNHGNAAVNGTATYLRAAWMPMLGGWDSGLGFQYFSGSASRNAGSGGDVDTDGWAIDAQSQGMLGKKPAGVYLSYATVDAGSRNLFNQDTNANKKQAWSVLGELGVIPDRMTVQLGYLDGDSGAVTGSSDQRWMTGITWLVAQNAQLVLWNTQYSGDVKLDGGGDNITSVMLFAAF